MRFESALILGLFTLVGLIPRLPAITITMPERIIVQERLVILREDPEEGYGIIRKQPITTMNNPVGVGEALGVWRISAYAQGDDFSPSHWITAQGWADGTERKMWPGVGVACPPSLPLGTFLWISGVGIRLCDDRGNWVTEGRLDLAMETAEQAMEWGVQWRKVIKLE